MKDQQLIFKRNKGTDTLFLLTSLIFVLGGFNLMDKNPTLGWMGMLFFGFIAFIFFLEIITNVSYIKIDNEGFEQQNLFNKRTYKWSDVDGFWKSSFRGNKKICFHLTQEYYKQIYKKPPSNNLYEKHQCITSSHNISTDELLQLMSKYKRKSKKIILPHNNIS